MSETGSTYQRVFKGHPAEAVEVRTWTHQRAPHTDAPAVANELFIAVLGAGADLIEITISTAGSRLLLAATGPRTLPLRHSHGPGWRIIDGLSRITGVTTDGRGLWAQMGEDL